MVVQNIPWNTRNSDKQHIYSILHAISYRKQSTLYIYIYIIIFNCKMDTFLKNVHRARHIYILVKQNRSLNIIQNIKLLETLNDHMQVRTGSGFQQQKCSISTLLFNDSWRCLRIQIFSSLLCSKNAQLRKKNHIIWGFLLLFF